MPAIHRQAANARTYSSKQQDIYLPLLLHLGNAIDSSLAVWEAYITELRTQPDFTSITKSNNRAESATTADALEYIFLNLSLRHELLVKSYRDPKLKSAELPGACDNLLVSLRQDAGNSTLDSWFDEVLSLEDNVRQLEVDRKQELTKLKGVQTYAIEALLKGELSVGEVEDLMDAMEVMGVSLLESEGLEES